MDLIMNQQQPPLVLIFIFILIFKIQNFVFFYNSKIYLNTNAVNMLSQHAWLNLVFCIIFFKMFDDALFSKCLYLSKKKTKNGFI